MRPDTAHAWKVSPREAVAIQQRLRSLVIDRDRAGRIESVAGVDVGFEREGRITRAAVAVLDLADLRLIDTAVVRRKTGFPYVPGLLSFREIPAVLEVLHRLRGEPDLIVCDGQGRAHPRRFGLACHLGVITGRPTIGVAKSRLVGTHDAVPDRRGAWVPLRDGAEIIGAVLRTRVGVKPVFVSVGHRVSLERAIELTLACTPRYRLPETTRQAHRLASGD
jgi:deoxyribonuclease V